MRSRSPAKGRAGLHTQHRRRNSYDPEFEHNTTTSTSMVRLNLKQRVSTIKESSAMDKQLEMDHSKVREKRLGVRDFAAEETKQERRS
ncbi:hypothetical protein SESBI_10994 [Sesbania bispinosa]|nr:hypothetical protein SESBI_10994 [Sesbania bispinosa]